MLFRSRSSFYERLLAEKDAQLRQLAAEIDWLRASVNLPSFAPVLSPAVALAVADGQAAEITDGGWESEEDEAQAILEKHGLSAIHLPEILDGLGYGNSDLS